MRVELFDHLLLLAAIAAAATIVRIMRRSEGIGRGYAIVVGLELILAVSAMGASRSIGAVALALVAATVGLPWLLEHGSRWAFARGHFAWVGRMSGLRASLMLGSGLARQLPILEGLSLLERDGVDAALAHYRRLADEAEDGAEIAMIHEQIVAMLFHGQRWDEGIAHYERRFHAGYAALRPSLALGLLRAYGESGRLETAAGLLRELEDGPIGADPKTAELLGQARLTFLAYVGAVEPVSEVGERERFEQLGLTAATATLFKGIAQAQAGSPRAAVETLTKIEDLAGPRDHRVLAAARVVLERAREVLEGPAGGGVELPPELQGYAELVSARLRSFVSTTSLVRRHERPVATYLIIAGLSLVYAVHLLRGGGGVGLLELGALSEELWRGGSWGRLLTSAWIHTDLVGLLFDAYAIWLAGQIVERILGPARMALVTAVAAMVGTVTSVVALPLMWDLGLDTIAVVAPTAGNLMAVGAITAALWMLTPRLTPALAPRARRNLVVTLGLLLVANLLTHWPLHWPAVGGVAVAPLALLTTIVFASLVALALPVEQPSWLRVGTGLVLAAALGANLLAFVAVAREQPGVYLVDNRALRCELGGVVLRTPVDMAPTSLEREVPYGLPILDGITDTLELRDGGLVQLAVSKAPPRDGWPAIFELVEGLDKELSVTAAGALPEPFAERVADDHEGRWRAFDLWRNGERVGRVVERRLGDLSGEEEGEGGEGKPALTLMIVATPVEALGHGEGVYAAIMRDASLSEDPGRTRCVVE